MNFYGQQGFGAIAITDHLCEKKSFLGKAASYLNKTLTEDSFPQYIEDIQKAAEYAKKRYGMLVLPGFELTKNSLKHHRSAHLLALNVTNWISADLDIFEMCRQIREAGGFAVAAHPLSVGSKKPDKNFLWDLRYELASYVDAWEVTNTGKILSEVLQSKLPKIATSDLHKASQINSWKTFVDSELHPEALVDSLRKQKISFHYYQSSSWSLADSLRTRTNRTLRQTFLTRTAPARRVI